MTTGKSRWRLSLTLLLAAVTAPAFAEGWGLDQLMRALQAQPVARAQFVETKHLAILDSTLEVRGTLEFRAPDYLRRQQTQPQQQSFEVQGQTVTLERPGQAPRQIALADYPPLAGFIDSLRATLAGDRAALERHYRLNLKGDAANWDLKLTPRPGPLAQHVERLSLQGRYGRLTRIEMREAGGDRTVTELSSLPARR
jgi:outer membrane lipoprotein-sorting protein